MPSFELFTYPACRRCEEVKELLKAAGLSGREYSLAEREGKQRVRDYLSLVRRDETGGMLLPILVLGDDEGGRAVLQSREDVEAWLRSRA